MHIIDGIQYDTPWSDDSQFLVLNEGNKVSNFIFRGNTISVAHDDRPLDEKL